MIPAQAVEAAYVAYTQAAPYLTTRHALIEALEAAAPHMLAELRELVEDMEAQPWTEVGAVRGMATLIRSSTRGIL